jgi:hypothetical protein
MRRYAVFLISAVGLFPFTCGAQQAAPDLPDAPKPSHSVYKPTTPSYSPPTQAQRFKNYVRQTYGLNSLIEAGARGGISEATDSPSQWPQGGQGYADRFGSAAGEIAIRGTTEYVIADLFKEDLRIRRCGSPCDDSIFKRAFEDTFTARKGEDGHHVFSVARLLGPISGSAVAINTWYPADSGRSTSVREVGKETARNYGFVFSRNLIRELWHH